MYTMAEIIVYKFVGVAQYMQHFVCVLSNTAYIHYTHVVMHIKMFAKFVCNIIMSRKYDTLVFLDVEML